MSTVKTKEFSDEVRARVVTNNQKISQHADRKELQQALELFEKAVESNEVNTHTYSSIINAAIRCGEIKVAEDIVEKMKNTRFNHKDVVLATTMMKGYCNHGRLFKALSLYQDMITNKPKVTPNIRTINTLLRGCVQLGSITEAETLINDSTKTLNIPLDESSWEYYIILLSQNLNLDKLLPLVGRLNKEEIANGLINIYIHIARAAGLLGEFKNCRKYLQLANDLLNTTASEDNNKAVQEKAVNANQATVSKEIVGGKRAWKTDPSQIDEKRIQSLVIYREHLKEEWKYESQLLTQFLALRTSKDAPNALDFAFPHYQRLLVFDHESKLTPLQQIIEGIFVKSGFESFIKKITTFSYLQLCELYSTEKYRKDNKIKLIEDSKLTDKSKDMQQKLIEFYSILSSYFTESDNKLQFEHIFQSIDDKSDNSSSNSRKLKMEICSGAGEWATNQAANDPTSGWFTLELRHDRVYQTFMKKIYSQLHNLCVMCGDALDVLPNRIPDSSLDNIFVNHPEPPQQTGREDSEAKHLLNKEFFEEIERILKFDGMCTIVTDNLWYGKLLIRLLTGMSALTLHSIDSFDQSKSNWQVEYEVDGYILWVGEPGSEAGHVVSSSSYFDRLWKRSQLNERYFIILKKLDPSKPIVKKVKKPLPYSKSYQASKPDAQIDNKKGKNDRMPNNKRKSFAIVTDPKKKAKKTYFGESHA